MAQLLEQAIYVNCLYFRIFSPFPYWLQSLPPLQYFCSKGSFFVANCNFIIQYSCIQVTENSIQAELSQKFVLLLWLLLLLSSFT